ncbi:MAG: rhodanese-like domain-containing protein [Aquisalimonadaceae bacterium]
MPQVSAPTDIRTRIDQNEPLFLLDVRETWETEICRIPGSVNIPMGEIPARVAEIPTDKPVVCICHHGARSLQVAHFLEQKGINGVVNLTGGVEAWATTVDPEMARY